MTLTEGKKVQLWELNGHIKKVFSYHLIQSTSFEQLNIEKLYFFLNFYFTSLA